MRTMTDSDRSLLLLHLDGLQAKQIADILGIAPAAVRKRISRAKLRLADVIKHMKEKT